MGVPSRLLKIFHRFIARSNLRGKSMKERLPYILATVFQFTWVIFMLYDLEQFLYLHYLETGNEPKEKVYRF